MFKPLPPVENLPPDRVALGRDLFHDTRLSKDNTLSCASCHSLDLGGADGRVSSLGINGQVGPINSPTVLNARFNFVQFWDGRAADLKAQAAGPVANPKEMGHTWDGVVANLVEDTALAERFRRVYPTDGLTAANIQDAIATYEMTLVTPSRFDRFLSGERTALTAEETAGLHTFINTGCTACHTGVNVGGTMFQKMGLVRDYFADRGNPTEADNGRFNVTHHESDRHFFKVPTLRNIALTAPYFHDGHAKTLEDAIRLMARYQLGRELEATQIRQIAAFLGSLTGDIPDGARLSSTAPQTARQNNTPGTAPR